MYYTHYRIYRSFVLNVADRQLLLFIILAKGHLYLYPHFGHQLCDFTLILKLFYFTLTIYI
jgi:hypothetical protein